MNYLDKRKLIKSGYNLPILGFGAAPFMLSNNNVNNNSSAKTINSALNMGINYFDTAPWYGLGRSELRIGNILREMDRDKFILSTKVGRILKKTKPLEKSNVNYALWENEISTYDISLKFYVHFDYSYDGILRSYEDSMQRLGFSKIDMLVIHDLDFYYHKTEEKLNFYLNQLDKGGGWKALEELRSSGEISAIGVGVNGDGLIPYFIPRFDIDFFLVAMRYTLLKQNVLSNDFPLCKKHNVNVVIGSPYQSGILATGLKGNDQFEFGEGPTYNYKKPRQEIIEKIKVIQNICDDFKVNIGAVSLQFPLLHPSVVSVIPGVINEQQIKSNIENLSVPIPKDLWKQLVKHSIIREDSPTEYF